MTRRKVLIALAAAAALLPACAGEQPPTIERRLKLQGKVVAVKTNYGAHHLRIDGEEVRGETGGGGGRGGAAVFMEKMTMDWRVKPEENITSFQPGDEITADIVVAGIRTHYLENVTVTKKAAEAAPPSEAPPLGK